MFHIQDPRYESLAVQALGTFMVEQCVQQSLSLGAKQAAGKGPVGAPSPPDLTKHAASRSLAHVMRQCRRQLEQQRALLRPHSNIAPPTSADEVQRSQRAAVLQRLLEQLVASEEPPSVKLGQLQAMLADALDAAVQDWSFVVQLLSTALALCKLEYGDWAERVAHAELDVALAYCLLHSFEMAVTHCDQCSAVLQKIGVLGESRGDGVAWISARHSFVLAAATSVGRTGHADATLRRLERSAREFSSSKPSAPSFAYHFVRLCCAVAIHRNSQEHHQAVLDAVDATLPFATTPDAVTWTYCAVVALHLPLLVAADDSLRSLGIPSAKEQLAKDVSSAASKKELEEVGIRLKATLAALQERSTSLQLCIVRQVDALNSHFRSLFAAIDGVAGASRAASVRAAVLRYAWLRCLAIGLRRAECDALAPHVVQGLAAAFDAQHAVVACAFVDIGCALSEHDVCRMCDVVSARKLCLHRDCPFYRPQSDSAAADDGDKTKPSADGDDDESHEHFSRRSIHYLTRGLQLLMADSHSTYATWPIVSVAVHQLTLLHHRLMHTKREVHWLSVLAALSAEVRGPNHAETGVLVKLVAGKQGRVHAPLFAPSWGVQCLLTNVQLTCDTDGAELFFSVAEERAADGTAPFVRYVSPIQLDRTGRVVIRAYAAKDGMHSGVVESRFSVIHRSD